MWGQRFLLVKTGHLKRRQKYIKKVIIKKFSKQFCLFTCILPTFCPQQTPVYLRQPTVQRQSKVRTQQKKIIGPILSPIFLFIQVHFLVGSLVGKLQPSFYLVWYDLPTNSPTNDPINNPIIGFGKVRNMTLF